MRPGFQEITSGWILYSGTEDLDARIERLGKWAADNGPLEPDEQATVGLMIQCQVARHMDPSGGDDSDDEGRREERENYSGDW